MPYGIQWALEICVQDVFPHQKARKITNRLAIKCDLPRCRMTYNPGYIICIRLSDHGSQNTLRDFLYFI